MGLLPQNFLIEVVNIWHGNGLVPGISKFAPEGSVKAYPSGAVWWTPRVRYGEPLGYGMENPSGMVSGSLLLWVGKNRRKEDRRLYLDTFFGEVAHSEKCFVFRICHVDVAFIDYLSVK